MPIQKKSNCVSCASGYDSRGQPPYSTMAASGPRFKTASGEATELNNDLKIDAGGSKRGRRKKKTVGTKRRKSVKRTKKPKRAAGNVLEDSSSIMWGGNGYDDNIFEDPDVGGDDFDDDMGGGGSDTSGDSNDGAGGGKYKKKSKRKASKKKSVIVCKPIGKKKSSSSAPSSALYSLVSQRLYQSYNTRLSVLSKPKISALITKLCSLIKRAAVNSPKGTMATHVNVFFTNNKALILKYMASMMKGKGGDDFDPYCHD